MVELKNAPEIDESRQKSGKWILKIKQCKRNKVVRSKSSPDLIPVSKETKSNEQSLVIGMSEDSKLNLI